MTKFLSAMGLLLLILLAGCSKSHSPQPGLTGRWQLDDAVSVDPGTVVDYAGGSVLELRSDSTYTFMVPRGTVSSGTYGTSASGIGIAVFYFLYLKEAGGSDSSRFQMNLVDLKLTLTGRYAIEHYHKL
jgi:hypothetical protein